MAEKVILGLSDGVDSAVAAYLLKQQGYSVTGVYLDIAGEKEREDALSSARRLGIELITADVRDEMDEKVCRPFAFEYLSGRTPSPCVGCNARVKLPVLERVARENGARLIATGHYVRREGTELYRGSRENDQSYMLSRITGEQAEHLLLPLGGMNKTLVRKTAEEIGLSVACKGDSRENCFVPKGDKYYSWLEARFDTSGEGDIMLDGRVIGRHGGIHRYTVGQRLPEETDKGRWLYVYRIDAENNRIEAAEWDRLFTNEITVSDAVLRAKLPDGEFRARVQVRHTRWEVPECTVYREGERLRVVCESPLRAPAPGQAAAFYDGDRLLGGGVVCG